jgi:peptidoglycan/LPS O-acetylase OafA/YrhL
MRVFSICWVILGHDEWLRVLNIKNWVSTMDLLQTPGLSTLAASAYYAVDVFFWIGGFLITITLAEKMLTMKKVILG